MSLKLYNGKPTDVFAVQVSTTGAAGAVGGWKTIKMKKEFISSAASADLINADGKFIHQPLNLILSDATTEDGQVVSVATNQTVQRPLLKVSVDLHIFATAGYSEPFYIRFIQESVSNKFQPNWAIADINIISRDQQVNYPTLDVNDTATLFHRNKKIATPNFINLSLIHI